MGASPRESSQSNSDYKNLEGGWRSQWRKSDPYRSTSNRALCETLHTCQAIERASRTLSVAASLGHSMKTYHNDVGARYVDLSADHVDRGRLAPAFEAVFELVYYSITVADSTGPYTNSVQYRVIL